MPPFPSPPKGVPNNYETDLLFPLLARAAALAGVDYRSADAATQTALKVIGDHTRAGERGAAGRRRVQARASAGRPGLAPSALAPQSLP
jgi:hypothetical protein